MKVALFDPVGTWRSAPTLPCILEDLAARGAETDVFLRLGGEGLDSLPLVRARPFPVIFRPWAGEVRSTLRNWKYFWACSRGRNRATKDDGRYDLAIGVNPEGVIAAHRLHQRQGTPFAYLSFEMMFHDELRLTSQQMEKVEEITASREAAVVISQDEWRAALLAAENGLSAARILLLPVAPRETEPPRRSNWLREAFSIAAHKTVVLHAGSFGAFTCADELIDSLPQWPSRFVLVVNTYYRPRSDDPYLRRLEALRLPNIRIGPGALSAREYEEMIASADIGLALYRPSGIPPFGGRNLATVGLSSGKLSSYVRAGVPVVSIGNPHIERLMDQYGFGLPADRAADLPRVLEAVRDGREEFSRGARTFFLERLDFGRFWPAVWRRLASVCETRLGSPVAASTDLPHGASSPLRTQSGAPASHVDACSRARDDESEA